MAEVSYKQLSLQLSGEVSDMHDKETNENIRSSKPNVFVKPMSVIKIFSFIVLYLGLSICLTFYQKWILQAVKYPLTIVMVHLVLKFFLAAFVRFASQQIYSRKLPNIDILTSIRTIGPTGIASGIDIGFSNWGLELVTVSLYTMTKSTTIIFILIFAILLKLEKLAPSLVIIVGMIASGLFMFTYKSTSFDAFGFVFLLIASMASGVRWSFAQMIMQTSKLGLRHPVDMMFYMQPWMFLSLLPFMLGFEGPKLWSAYATIDREELYFVLMKITLGGVIAFIMEISEYLVLSHTSSLTLSITGIFKEICQLVLAVQVNGDILSVFNMIGLILCLGGICCHVIHKYLVLFSNENIKQIEFKEKKKVVNKNSINATKQKIPLLNAENLTDSDADDSTDDNKINSSEVIFDILKRRDSRR